MSLIPPSLENPIVDPSLPSETTLYDHRGSILLFLIFISSLIILVLWIVKNRRNQSPTYSSLSSGSCFRSWPGSWSPLKKIQSWVRRFFPSPSPYHLASTSANTSSLSFQDSINAGLTSDSFDLTLHNSGDSRTGLPKEEMESIQRLMTTQSLSFDDARLSRMKSRFEELGIDFETGLPLSLSVKTKESKSGKSNRRSSPTRR